MKTTLKSTSGTSFYDVTFKASVNKLISIIGEPTMEDNTGKDKVNFDWHMEIDNGDVFTIYDWKEYRKLDLDENIEWHIGAHSKPISTVAKVELLMKFI
jgi:hypothetical protein